MENSNRKNKDENTCKRLKKLSLSLSSPSSSADRRGGAEGQRGAAEGGAGGEGERDGAAGAGRPRGGAPQDGHLA